ncbi:hypothetical protein VOLCADRAFT_104769, partial [Volvox carteri f. nagariensis]
ACADCVLNLNADCAIIPGYTLSPGADHYGDDINCQITTANWGASICSSRSDCKAFNSYTIQDGTQWSCAKRVASPLANANGICFYTKINNPCAQVPGYKLAADQDHFGDDIYCVQLSLTDAISRCNSDTRCKSFNTWYLNNDGSAYACLKTVGTPTTPKAGVCSYVKV